MKLNKNGFTLVELIGVLVILSLLVTVATSVFINVRNNVLDKEYNNLVEYLETKAVEYANNNDITMISVGDLIKEGYVDPDDEEKIYDPRNNKSLNCYLIEVSFKDDEYVATFIEEDKSSENGSCEEYNKYSDYQICYMDNDECISFSSDKWFSDNVTLGINRVNEIDAKYSWQTNKGDYSYDAYIKTKVNTVGVVYYTCKIEDGEEVGNASKIVRIDKETPVVTSVVMDEEWTINKEVVINASDGIGSGVKDYGYGENECVYQDSNKIIVNDNGKYKFCVRDKVGNVYEFMKEINTIDTEPPVVSGENPSDVYEGDSYDLTQNFEVKCPITGCKSITYNYKNTNELKTGSHTITIYVLANNGKSVSKSISINVLPKITAKWASDIIEGTDNKVIDYFSVKCSSSGCNTTCNYESTKDLTVGSYLLTCSVSYNNQYSMSASVNLNVLPSTPSVPSVVAKFNNASGSSYDGSWTNQNVYYSLSPSKDTDKVTKYQIYRGSTLLKEVTATNNKASYTHSSEVESNIYIKACNGSDCSGKTSAYQIKIDKTKPTCKLSVTTSKISFSSKSSDVVSYGVSTSSTASYGTTSVSIAKKTFYGHVLDRAGNTGTCKAEVTGTTKDTYTYSCSYDCGYYEESCEYVCYRYMTSAEKASGTCSGAATEGAYNTCWKWHSSSSCSSTYPYLDTSGTSCSGSTYVSKTCYSTCTGTDYTCSSGYTYLSKNYCYKLS